MKIILAPDSFKGTLSALDAALIMKQAIQKKFPDADAIPIPIADGGEGTVDAFFMRGPRRTRHGFRQRAVHGEGQCRLRRAQRRRHRGDRDGRGRGPSARGQKT